MSIENQNTPNATEKVVNDIISLAKMFLKHLNTQIPDTAKFSYREGYVTCRFDNKVIIFSMNSMTVEMHETVKHNLLEGFNSNDNNSSDESIVDLLPPIDSDDNVDENNGVVNDLPEEIETELSLAEKIFEDTVANIEKFKKKAAQTSDTMYVNPDGSVCYPYNFDSQRAGYAFQNNLSIDDYDELVDMLIRKYPGLEVLEDENGAMCFHLKS